MDTLASEVTDRDASRWDELMRLLKVLWLACGFVLDSERVDEKEDEPDVHMNSPTPLSPLLLLLEPVSFRS